MYIMQNFRDKKNTCSRNGICHYSELFIITVVGQYKNKTGKNKYTE